MQLEKLDKLLVRRGNRLDDMVKEAQNTNQCRAGLQHQAQQPRLAVKADVQQDKETRESTEYFAQDGRLGDISSAVIKITLNLRLSLVGMMPWSIKTRKWQSRVSHPWRCASQHLPAAYYTPAQLQLTKHKEPTFPHNFCLGASVRQARRRIFVRQDIHSPSTTVPGTQR